MKTYVNDMDMKRKGYLEGEERGLERGRSEREQELLQNLMNTMHFTETEAREKLGMNLES